jgi:transposase
MARATLEVLHAQLRSLDAAIDELERAIVADHRRDPVSLLAASVPGVGAIAASAILASAPDPHAFKSGRDFAAWLGATPSIFDPGQSDRLRQFGLTEIARTVGGRAPTPPLGLARECPAR